jgi:hypothetical protein
MQRRNFLKALGGSISLLQPVAAAARDGQRPLELVRDGHSAYSIAMARDASPSERRAGEELQRFLAEMTGAHLPIVTDAEKARGNLVIVGKSAYLDALPLPIPFASLGAEGFAIKTAGNHLVIAGGRQRGTMYGVYTFLEKLGCRWFAIGVSRIPKKTTIVVDPIDETQQPAFEYREPFFSEAMDRDWAARNKMNGNHMPLDASTGGKVQYYPFVHSFYALVPPEQYFHDHPEYFALVDGRRRGERAQLCVTNPDVVRVATAQVFEWIRQHPEATIVSVSQNDYWGWCECDNCRRVEEEEGGAHSGPVLRFVNAVAAEVAKKYPDKLIDTLAYSYTEPPPRQVRPLPNVRIRMCPIGACEAHPYEQCRYDAYIMNNLRAWQKITDGNLYIWHYNTDFSHYLRPYPDFAELAADIPMYRRHRVVGLFMEGGVTAGGGAENGALRSYVMARLLWDTNTNVRKDIEEFHAAFYGRAASAMLEYFDLLQHFVSLPPAGEGHHCWCCSSPQFSDEFLAQAQRLFAQAQAAAEDDAVRKRVRQAKISLDYLEFVRAKRFRVRNGVYEPDDLADVKNRYQSFIGQLQSFGITDPGEGQSIEQENKNFAHVQSYAVQTLENAALRVHVAPGLSGRVIQMIDKRTGRDALAAPDPEAPSYPDVAGLVFGVYEDYVAPKPLEVKWEAEASSTNDRLVLTGTSSEGLQLKRTLQFSADGTALHTESEVRNVGTEAIEVVLQSRFEANPTRGPAPEEMDDVAVSFTSQEGKTVAKKLLDPEQAPVGNETYNGVDRPDGLWRLVNPRAGLTLANRFATEQVARCILRWTAKNLNFVGLVLWSERRALQPGETLRLNADYEADFQQGG